MRQIARTLLGGVLWLGSCGSAVAADAAAFDELVRQLEEELELHPGHGLGDRRQLSKHRRRQSELQAELDERKKKREEWQARKQKIAAIVGTEILGKK